MRSRGRGRSNRGTRSAERVGRGTEGGGSIAAEGRGTWWRHQMETISALLAICARNSPVPGEFPSQRPVTRSFDVFFDLRLNERLSKQSRGCWFETISRPLWRHRNERNRSRHIGFRKCPMTPWKHRAHPDSTWIPQSESTINSLGNFCRVTSLTAGLYIHHELIHDDVIKWKHFPHCWPFVQGIHRSPVNSPHKGQWRGTLMFFICTWTNGWVNNRNTGDLRCNHDHYDVTVMLRPGDAYMRHWTAITWPNDDLSSMGPMATNVTDFWIKIQQFSLKGIHLKVSSAKWRWFCFVLSLLRHCHVIDMNHKMQLSNRRGVKWDNHLTFTSFQDRCKAYSGWWSNREQCLNVNDVEWLQFPERGSTFDKKPGT